MINYKVVLSALTIIFFAVIALFIIRYFNIYIPLYVINTTKTSEFSVVGEGKVDAKPDIAYIRAGISVKGVSTVLDAKAAIDDTHNKIVDGLKSLGINQSNIQTTAYTISPNSVYGNGISTTQGYNGDASISVKVTNVNLVPKVIDNITSAGANEIQGVQFSINNPQKYLEEARNQAIENAKEQAQRLASELGIKLGKITNMVESVPTVPVQTLPSGIYNTSIGDLSGPTSPQIEPGIQIITSTVTIYFEKD